MNTLNNILIGIITTGVVLLELFLICCVVFGYIGWWVMIYTIDYIKKG